MSEEEREVFMRHRKGKGQRRKEERRRRWYGAGPDDDVEDDVMVDEKSRLGEALTSLFLLSTFKCVITQDEPLTSCNPHRGSYIVRLTFS